MDLRYLMQKQQRFNKRYIIVTLDQGVEWQSLDNQLTEFVIALFIPDAEAGTTHLKYSLPLRASY